MMQEYDRKQEEKTAILNSTDEDNFTINEQNKDGIKRGRDIS